MKKNVLRTCISMLVVIGLTTFIFAQDNNGNGYGLVKQQLDAYFGQLEEAKTFSGTVLVAKDGKVIFKKGYGMANYDEGIPNKPKTVQAIASLTKAFASMSIMMLEERGFLSVDDTIADYIPDFPNGDRVTLHQLLSQSSGLFDYLFNPAIWMNIDQFHNPEDLLQYYMNEPLQFEPGSRHEYSNSNYITLGIILERVSGMTFGDFIKANIFDPLKMRNSGYDPYETDFPDKAIGYDIVDPPLVTMYCHPTIPYTAGAIYSTVLDMYKWDQALYTEKLVSQATLQKMFTPGYGDYGYGWYINDLEVNGQMHKHIWHWGAYFGFHSFISRMVDDKITVILLLNISPTLGTPDDLRPLVQDAAGIVLENE
ncbi:MAG: beta-lactamase family protein [Candidatus Aminicenantes bacterium]|nr:beta-lactamase family protein [Candidatus Aminicenantes bacterium]